MQLIAELTARMAEFNAGEPALTQHLLKVHDFARTIGMLEGLNADMLHTLEIAALTHDIGIKPCMEKHGTCTGKMQEEEGPQHARAMLCEMGVEGAKIERVCYLIAHHHTYTNVDGLDYRILLEADFLVNIFEGSMKKEAREAAFANVFRTDAGKRLFDAMFGEAYNG